MVSAYLVTIAFVIAIVWISMIKKLYIFLNKVPLSKLQFFHTYENLRKQKFTIFCGFMVRLLFPLINEIIYILIKN